MPKIYTPLISNAILDLQPNLYKKHLLIIYMKKRKKRIDKGFSGSISNDILKARNSRKIYILFYLMIAIILIAIVYIKVSGRPLNNNALKLSLAFIIAVIIATEIHRIGNYYEINENSIIHKSGYFSTISKRLEFNAISDSHINQNLWQRLLNYGNIEIHMFARENNLIIKNLDNPFKFVEFLGGKMGGWRSRAR